MPRHPERAINLLLAPSAWSQSAHDCLATPSVSASMKAGPLADFVGPEMTLLAKASNFSEPFQPGCGGGEVSISHSSDTMERCSHATVVWERFTRVAAGRSSGSGPQRLEDALAPAVFRNHSAASLRRLCQYKMSGSP